MKIIVDLQPAQTWESGLRGLGRHALGFARALACEAREHELYFALSQAFPDGLDRVRAAFQDVLPGERFLVWHTPLPVAEIDQENQWRRQAGELIREQFFSRFRPDFLHICSLFEGRIDNVVTSVKSFTKDMPTSATLHDLIPYLDQARHLHGQEMTLWYMRKLAYLNKCDLLFAVSEHTRKEAIATLDLDPDKIVTIYQDVGKRFQKLEIRASEKQLLLRRYGISRDFLMCTAAMDFHKNLSGLLEAYVLLPADVRRAHQLVIVCKLTDEYRRRLRRQCRRFGLSKDEIVLTGFVGDDELVALYNLCKLFVLPSLHEGFGLPALEAMRCGAPVVGSNRASIPEVIGLSAALFDPASPDDMTKKIYQALSDFRFRGYLRKHSQRQARKFSWRATAKRALEAFEAWDKRAHEKDSMHRPTRVKLRLAYVSTLFTERSDSAHDSIKLLPELAAHYRIELVTDAEKVNSDLAGIPVVSVAEFERDAQRYDRIVYDSGNTAIGTHVLTLLKRFPGTVVVRDVDNGGELGHIQDTTDARTVHHAVYRAYGYAALRRCCKNADATPAEYSCHLTVWANAQGMIFHSQSAQALSLKWRGFELGTEQVEAVPSDWQPKATAQCYVKAIERFAANHPLALQRHIAKAVAGVQAPVPVTQGDLVQTALAMSENSPRIGQRQLLVDISTLVRIDSRSGIQRVVRSLLNEFLARAPAGFRVEPVYRASIGYRYARRFTTRFLNINMRMEDDPVEVDNGDIFLGLDLDAEMDEASELWLRHHRRRGLKVYYVVYDLLAVLHPQWFPPVLSEAVGHWLQKIVEFADGFACISRSVARDLEGWLQSNPPQRRTSIGIGDFHLGADIESSRPSRGMSNEDTHVLRSLSKRTSLLMVGTIEPRKGHAQVLSAMEQLWKKGAELQLVIVGKPGWLVKPLIKRLRSHTEIGRRLYWLEQVSDAALLKLYEGASALLAPSEGEGFGLPLIEAAQHELPIIARDLPVFREVAGEHAFYFEGLSPEILAEKLEEWLVLHKERIYPNSAGIDRLTWRESAAQLKGLLTKGGWSKVWKPEKHLLQAGNRNFSHHAIDNRVISTIEPQ